MQVDIFRKYGAKAIWADDKELPNRYLRFQGKFNAQTGKKVQFYVCTDTKYELYINGNLAAFGQYEDFPQKKIYDEIDISDYIEDGENLVSVLAYSQGEDSMQHMCGLPMVIFAAVSDGKALFVSDESIKCADSGEFISGEFEKITSQRSFNFGFNLKKDDGWRGNNVSGNWQSAVICDDSGITYLPRPIKMLKISGTKCGKIITQGEFSYGEGKTVAEKMQKAQMAYRDKAEVFKETYEKTDVLKDNTYWIIDLGEETAGYITLDVEAQDDAVLDIAIGEHLADMRVRSYVGGRNYAFSCTCREGRQQISFYVKRIAGRYLQIFAHGGIRSVYKAGLLEVEYPISKENKFSSSDRLFNKIYSVCLRTLKLCMHEHYEDCPQRELALYGMDSRNQMLSGYYAFFETAMPRASLELLAQSQLKSGLLEITAPAKFPFTIPSFSLAWIIALKEYVLFTNDKSFGENMLKTARKILDYFADNMKDGLVAHSKDSTIWNFYEWTEKMDNERADADSDFDAPINALFALALKEYKQLCEWAEKQEEIKWGDEIYNKILSAFHKTFYYEDKKAYCTYIGNEEPHFAQLTQAWALLSGLVPDECEKAVREKLISDDLVEISLSYTAFKYDALMQEPEKYINVVLDDIENQWGYMLYSGATSFWETILGEADFDGAGSLCHGWSAVPVYVFWRYVLGVYPTSPGVLEQIKNINTSSILKIEAELKTSQGILKVNNT
ncbi:MAG: hypothetical protein II978_02485 [Clostridia bacterium]|nr:hypothetical protein [Clostridia bacterium]